MAPFPNLSLTWSCQVDSCPIDCQWHPLQEKKPQKLLLNKLAVHLYPSRSLVNWIKGKSLIWKNKTTQTKLTSNMDRRETVWDGFTWHGHNMSQCFNSHQSKTYSGHSLLVKGERDWTVALVFQNLFFRL